MNPRLKMLFVFGAFATALIAFVVVKKVIEGKPPAVSHSFVLGDISDSMPDGCSSLAALSKRAIESPDMQQGSTVTVAVTGDDTTANEPKTLGTYPVPTSIKAVEGTKVLGQKRNELLEKITGKCAGVSALNKSSIFLGIKNGVEQLRSQNCNEKNRCSVFVKSDLQETADKKIEAALSGNKAAMSHLPTPINNEGISITICGIAETRGLVKEQDGKSRRMTQNRTGERSDLIRDVWGRLFTTPALVSFSAFCVE
ncbi:MAG: hypothetical protein ACKVRN_08680 [Pyrinomonadaceae bacterium]